MSRLLCVYKLILSFIICFTYTQSSLSQSAAIKLSSNTIDFGRIAAIVYPAKILGFTNTGNEKLAIFLVEKSSNVKVNFQQKFYLPGEKGYINVYYEAKDLGDFSEDLKIYTNLDPNPVIISLKGTCISIQECFPNINNLNLRNIMVINKNTQVPVPLAL